MTTPSTDDLRSALEEAAKAYHECEVGVPSWADLPDHERHSKLNKITVALLAFKREMAVDLVRSAR